MVRRPSWISIFVGGALALLAAVVILYLYAVREQVHRYYETELVPERLQPAAGPPPPPAFRLTDVPWIQSDLDLPFSLSFEMLAAQQGRDESRQIIDFLMGTTWGATAIPRQIGFIPGQDPEVGFRHAASALGFARHYLVTNDGERYVRELKAQLSSGRAVRVAVDLVKLEKRALEEPTLHSIVLVGYDEASFEYYEPVCRPHAPTPCEPGTHPPGLKGLTVPTKQLLDAVDQTSLVFKYPWSYQLLVLEKGAPTSAEGYSMALRRNGRALVGFKRDDFSSGAEAIDETAKDVSRAKREGFTKALERGVRLATLVRRDDARILSVLFPGDPRAEIAATHLEHAAEAYAKAVATFVDGKSDVFGLNDALVAAASADRSAGEALLLPKPDAGTH